MMFLQEDSVMDNNNMFMLVLFALVFGTCLLFAIPAQKYNQGHYDEMQEMNRGKAYKFAFLTTIGFLGIYFLYDYILGDTYIRLSSSLLAIFSIVLGSTVYIAYSIWNHAYIQVNQKGTGVFILYGSIAFINLATFALELDEFPFAIENGILQCSSPIVQLAMALVYGITPIVFFARKALDKREN